MQSEDDLTTHGKRARYCIDHRRPDRCSHREVKARVTPPPPRVFLGLVWVIGWPI